MQTLEAIVEANGSIRLLREIKLPGKTRALVTILDGYAENPIPDEEFEADMIALAKDKDYFSYDGAYSRADIYFDHD